MRASCSAALLPLAALRLSQTGRATLSATDGRASCWRRCARAPSTSRRCARRAKIDYMANGGDRVQASRSTLLFARGGKLRFEADSPLGGALSPP